MRIINNVQVRMTAVTAQMLHMDSAELMDKFAIVSSHIVETMIPIIIDAVEVLKVNMNNSSIALLEELENMYIEAFLYGRL